MATVKKTEQELYDDAEKELNDAKRVLEEFMNGRYGKRLTVLEDGLWEKKYSDKVEKNEWEKEKTQLEERQKRLEKRRDDWDVEVQKWGAKLCEIITQPGNDFVTWNFAFFICLHL